LSRICLVEETLRESRKSVAISRIVGKAAISRAWFT
jgi:hypothetical protein